MPSGRVGPQERQDSREHACLGASGAGGEGPGRVSLANGPDTKTSATRTPFEKFCQPQTSTTIIKKKRKHLQKRICIFKWDVEGRAHQVLYCRQNDSKMIKSICVYRFLPNRHSKITIIIYKQEVLSLAKLNVHSRNIIEGHAHQVLYCRQNCGRILKHICFYIVANKHKTIATLARTC